MRLEEHPTPRTDKLLEDTGREFQSFWLPDLARDLERRLHAIHALVEGDADGTVDSTLYEKLCNEIAGLTGITL